MGAGGLPRALSILCSLRWWTKDLVIKREDGRYEAADTVYDEFGHEIDRSYSADGAIREIESYISYLEDLPLEKVKSVADNLGRIEERLKKLREKLI